MPHKPRLIEYAEPCAGNGRPRGLQVCELFVAYPGVVAHRCQYLQTRTQRSEGNFETHLVVPGCRTTVRNRRRTAGIGEFGEAGGLQSALGTDAQRVGLAAQHVAGQQVTNHVVEKVFLGVDEYVFDSTQRQRAFFKCRGCGVVNTAGVDAGRDDVAPVFLLQPRHAERGVEAAGERKNNG